MAVHGDLDELRRRMPRTRARRSAASVVGDVLLTAVAALGAVCIALVIAALVFDVSIMLFRTGSMSPGIPAGSAALVREVPAASLEIGDVVTVDRPGKLPVTHRIVAIETDGDGDGDERRLTLRGDANPVDDPAPYEVSSARILLFAVPGVAPLLAAMGHPLVLGSLTIGATSLVMWAFWPRRQERARRARRDAGPGGPASARHRARPPTSSGAAALVLVALTAGAAPLLDPASAAASALASASTSRDETVVQGSVLRLVSIGDAERMARMAPGDRVAWEVGITAEAPERGEVTVTLSGSGDGGLGLVGDVRSCPVRWQGGNCPDPVTIVEGAPLPVDDVARQLFTMSTDEERWLRFDVSMLAGASVTSQPLGAVDLVVRAVGASDDIAVGVPGARPGSLGDTGVSSGTPLVIATLVAASGAVLLFVRRRAARRGGEGAA